MTEARDITGRDQQLVRYLLGLLPDDEAQRLDEASIVDDAVAGRLRTADDDLVDDYVRGALDGETAARFATYYLASPNRRQRVAFATRFVAAVDRAALSCRHATEEARTDPSSADRFRITPWAAIAWPLTAAALLVLMCGVVLGYLGLRHDRTDVAHAVEVPVRQVLRPSASSDESITAARDGSIALTLWPQTRSIAATPAVIPEADGADVSFLLALDTTDFVRYEADLVDAASGQIVWRSGPVPRLANSTRPTLSIAIPAALLKGERYAFHVAGLRGRGRAEPIATYLFAVDRR